MARYLLDDNGEILAEFNDDVKIVAYDILNAKRKSIENKMFYKLYKDTILVFTGNYISGNVLKTLFSLIRLLEFNTNEFVSFNGLPATIGQLQEYLKLKPKTFYNHLRKLEQLEIIKKIPNGKTSNVMINPYFISYGANNTDEALRLFSNSVWDKTSIYSKRKYRKRDVKNG